MSEAIDGRDRIAFVQGFLDKISRGDLPAVESALHPDFRYELAYPVAGIPTEQGIPEFVAMIGRVATLFDRFDMSAQVLHPTSDPEVIVAEYSVEGRDAATQLPYANRYCGILRIRDGRLLTFREYANSARQNALFESRGKKQQGVNA